MANTLYFDCSMGAAGDMIVAALLQLLPEPDAFVREFNALNIEQFGKGSVKLSTNTITRCGIAGLKADMLLTTQDGDIHCEAPDYSAHFLTHDHHHGEHEHCHGEHEHCHGEHEHCHGEHEHCHGEHEHCHGEHEHCHGEHGEHGHHHAHGMTLRDIDHILHNIDISATVRQHVTAIFDSLAQAEAKAHNSTVEQIHFHEVGQLDAVADILAACLLIDRLSPDKIYASSICVGHGFVKCAHGTLPVPAPATAELLRDIPIFSGPRPCEMCTPTGAAILKHFVHEFRALPDMSIEHIGYGMGHRDFPDAPNMLRAFYGQLNGSKSTEDLTELIVNVDDMTGEQLGFAIETLMSEGALDAWAEPILMKKGRPAYKLACLVRNADCNRFTQLMLRHSTSFGVRIFPCTRVALPRQINAINTPFGPIHQKLSTSPDIPRAKWEYDEIAAIARDKGLSIQDILDKLK